jgi:hypothetical protein
MQCPGAKSRRGMFFDSNASGVNRLDKFVRIKEGHREGIAILIIIMLELMAVSITLNDGAMSIETAPA